MPDKDCDGLSSGVILKRTLELLGAEPKRISVHLPAKGNNISDESERKLMASYDPTFIFVLDQGSRKGPRLINKADAKTLVVDHHYATEDDFPEGCNFVTACHSPPVATSSLLTCKSPDLTKKNAEVANCRMARLDHICEALHENVASKTDWLTIVGTHGDLGNSLKWEYPFPDMKDTFKRYTKKLLNDVVSLVNAPRRTATYDVRSAWDAICDTTDPALVLKDERLLAARAEVNAEVERCTHAAPKFSADGKVAVFRIHSQAQVHPVIVRQTTLFRFRL